jgi:DNA-binding Lrp family transcriptional regulator
MLYMDDLTITDMRLIDEVQRDFPLLSRPFRLIGERCGVSESEALERLGGMQAKGLIRGLYTVLDGKKLGYRTTLVAFRLGRAQVEDIARLVSAHPGVSHNYLRDHDYRLWFTLALKGGVDFGEEIERMLNGSAPVDSMVLPALRTFKLQVHFKFSGTESPPADFHHRGAESKHSEPVALSGLQKEVILALQNALRLEAEPFKTLSEKLGCTEEELFLTASQLKDLGVLRRISCLIRPHQAGYRGNAMVCFNIGPHELKTAGLKLARFAAVSHCYERRVPAGWHYPLFAMVHGKNREATDETIKSMAETVGCSDFQVLHTLKEYKKERIRYVPG